MDATVRFLELINSPGSIDLTEAWILLGAHADPETTAASQVARLDHLARECREPTLDELRRVLFDQEGFRGNAADYYAPSNSLLHDVLETRLGIPISLGALLVEVGRRVGIDLAGVGMPGHFLVGVPGADVFVDAFAGGRLLDAAACRALHRRLAGPGVAFHPSYLNPVPTAAILGRMVANLVNAYRRADDRQGLRWAARVRARCPEVTPHELMQLGDALARCGAYDEAAALFDEAGAAVPSDQAADLRLRALQVRARLN